MKAYVIREVDSNDAKTQNANVAGIEEMDVFIPIPDDIAGKPNRLLEFLGMEPLSEKELASVMNKFGLASK